MLRVLILAFLMMPGMMVLGALAHGVFTGLNDPETGKGCCNMQDCKIVPPWLSGAVTPLKEGYRVKLSVEGAKYFNPNMNRPVDAVFPSSRVIWGLASGWAICLNQSDQFNNDHKAVRCLIGAANT